MTFPANPRKGCFIMLNKSRATAAASTTCPFAQVSMSDSQLAMRCKLPFFSTQRELTQCKVKCQPLFFFSLYITSDQINLVMFALATISPPPKVTRSRRKLPPCYLILAKFSLSEVIQRIIANIPQKHSHSNKDLCVIKQTTNTQIHKDANVQA